MGVGRNSAGSARHSSRLPPDVLDGPDVCSSFVRSTLMKVTRVVTAEGRSGVVAHADAMNSGAARAVEYPSSGREMTTPAHETVDAAPPRHTRTRGRSSSSERELGAHLEEPWRRVALRLAGLLRVGSETCRKSAGDRGRHFAIAAMALATATSCGGARASKRCQFAASWDQADGVFRRVMGPPLLQAEGTTRGGGVRRFSQPHGTSRFAGGRDQRSRTSGRVTGRATGK